MTDRRTAEMPDLVEVRDLSQKVPCPPCNGSGAVHPSQRERMRFCAYTGNPLSQSSLYGCGCQDCEP